MVREPRCTPVAAADVECAAEPAAFVTPVAAADATAERATDAAADSSSKPRTLARLRRGGCVRVYRLAMRQSLVLFQGAASLCTTPSLGASVYRLWLYDTGGDGWQGATYKLHNSSSLADALEGSIVLSGTLGEGFEQADWICLADGCYEIVVGGGDADSEIGFEFVDEARGRGSRDRAAVVISRCRTARAVAMSKWMLL